MAEQRKNLGPATTSLSHDRQAKAVEVVRDVLAGTLHLREKGEKYLPKFPKEHEKAYKARLQSSVLFNATKKTRKAFAGMIFRKDPVIGDDVPDRIKEHLEDIDLTGRDLTAFSRDLWEDAEADGHACIFVDMDPPVEGAESPLDEADLRPYWVGIRKQDILLPTVGRIGGKRVLTGLRYRESIVEEDGKWGEVEVHRVREYFLGINPDNPTQIRVFFNIWELDRDKEYPGESEKDWAVVAGWNHPSPGGMMAISRIPITATYTGRTGFFESDSPMLDLALENLKHYQTDSDNQNLARTAKVQTLVFTGESADAIHSVAVGPGNAIVLENPEADAKWIGADGSSFKDFADDLKNIERRMAVMGLSMLMSDSRAAETAESKRIDKGEADSQLADSAKDLQRAITEALSFHAEWMDKEDGGHVGVNTDFDTEPLDSATFKEFRELWAERGISWDTLMKIAEKGELMPEGFDREEERKRIAEEDVARMDAGVSELFGEGDEEDEAAQ